MNRALGEIREMYDQERSEKSQIMGLHEDFKKQFVFVQTQLDECRKNLQESELRMQEQDDQFDAEKRHLRHQLEMKKRDLEERESQLNQAIDPEIMRLKLKKDIEAPL